MTGRTFCVVVVPVMSCILQATSHGDFSAEGFEQMATQMSQICVRSSCMQHSVILKTVAFACA